MIKIYFDGQTTTGAYIQNAFVWVSEDYTMLQLVTAIKEAEFVSFKTHTMNRLVKIS